MKYKTQQPLLSALLGTGLYLLESLRERMPDNVDDLRGRVRDTYDTASGRMGRATAALRGEEDSHLLGTVGALLAGVGIGVGIELGSGTVTPGKGGVSEFQRRCEFSSSMTVLKIAKRIAAS